MGMEENGGRDEFTAEVSVRLSVDSPSVVPVAVGSVRDSSRVSCFAMGLDRFRFAKTRSLRSLVRDGSCLVRIRFGLGSRLDLGISSSLDPYWSRRRGAAGDGLCTSSFSDP